MRTNPRLLAGLSCWLLVVGCTASSSGSRAGHEAAPSAEAPEASASLELAPLELASGSAYADAVADADAEIAGLRTRAVRMPTSAIAQETLSNALRSRAGLTGSYDDYVAAERAMSAAFDINEAGPYLSRAHLRFTLHRLAEAEADLTRLSGRLLMNDSTRAEMTGLRGELELHSGRFEEARRSFAEAYRLHPAMTSAFRVALHRWQTGAYDAALRWIDTAEGHLVGAQARPRSFLHLSRGLIALDRGRYEAASAHYRAADRAFPGSWLVHEHIAEAAALTGDTERAAVIYRDVVERTGHPDLIDAWAGLQEASGDQAGAERSRAEARAGFEAQLSAIPSAAHGHALEHFLVFGPPERALELAQASHALRPGGREGVLLAQARLVNGDLEQAKREIDAVLASPYRHAELFQTAAIIERARGDEPRARAHHEAAAALNPHVDLSYLGRDPT